MSGAASCNRLPNSQGPPAVENVEQYISLAALIKISRALRNPQAEVV